MKQPEEHVKLFDTYEPLISGKVSTYIYIYMYCIFFSLQYKEDLQTFLNEEHSFLEYEKMVLRYEELREELQYGIDKVRQKIHVLYTFTCTWFQVAPLGLFCLQLDQACYGLVKDTKDLIDTLIKRMCQDNQNMNNQ